MWRNRAIRSLLLPLALTVSDVAACAEDPPPTGTQQHLRHLMMHHALYGSGLLGPFDVARGCMGTPRSRCTG